MAADILGIEYDENDAEHGLMLKDGCNDEVKLSDWADQAVGKIKRSRYSRLY